MRATIMMFALLLPGSLGAAPPVATAAPIFVREQFFLGATEGIGAVKVFLSHRRGLTVHGVGRVAAGDTIVLDQTVQRSGVPSKKREWRLRRLSDGRYAGSLSDAVGPVAGDVTGNCFHVRYAMKSGVAVEQFLYLQPDARTVLNRMSFRKFGVVVGRLEETIRRVD